MNYQICQRCIIDNVSPNTNLILDNEGICSTCRRFEKEAKPVLEKSQELKNKELAVLLDKIKSDGQGKTYDCVLGLSGGVDSSYLAYLAKEWGLRPLVIHFDNGWNSELAVSNIHSIVSKLGYDLYTYVIDWEEFKDLQLAYLKASVVDIEVPTDHFIYATLMELACEHKIKYILDGNNIATEFAGGNWKWSFNKLDLVNMMNIHKKFGTIKLKKFPRLGYYQRYYYQHLWGIQSVYPLNYIPYIKADVKQLLKEKLDWRDYGGKHYESVWTKFYQAYILPVKFGIDKRKMHLSNLIWSGQMTREDALADMQKPLYDENELRQDRLYVIKKFGLTEAEFDKIMQLPVVPHEFYGVEADEEKNHQRFEYMMNNFPQLMRIPIRIARMMKWL